jgi:uncharacterized protein with HEPN domain
MVEPIDHEQYHATEFPRIGVERYLIGIGDALRAALRHEPELAGRIPDARNAIDLRNFLTHAYMYIDDKIVWNVATVRLADLLRDLDGVIQERGAKSPDNRERLDRDHRPH